MEKLKTHAHHLPLSTDWHIIQGSCLIRFPSVKLATYPVDMDAFVEGITVEVAPLDPQAGRGPIRITGVSEQEIQDDMAGGHQPYAMVGPDGKPLGCMNRHACKLINDTLQEFRRERVPAWVWLDSAGAESPEPVFKDPKFGSWASKYGFTQVRVRDTSDTTPGRQDGILHIPTHFFYASLYGTRDWPACNLIR